MWAKYNPRHVCYSCCSCWSTILLELAYSLLYINFLRYNSHITQFTHLKCTIPWFSVYSKVCSHHHNFSTSSSLAKEINMNEELFPTHYNQTLHLSAMTNLISVSIYLPILGISYTWEYTSLVISLTSFTCFIVSTMFSKFIHAVICYFFLWLRNISYYGWVYHILHIHLPADGHMSCFCFLAIRNKLLWTLIDKFLCGHIFSFLCMYLLLLLSRFSPVWLCATP